MKIKLIFSLSVLLFLQSCESGKPSNQANKIKKEIIKPVHSNASACFNVEGMVCKMGCGGTIRKTLVQGGGVERVKVSFVEEAKNQEIYVYYDSTKTNINQLKSLIEHANDGQFKVTKATLIADSK